MQGLLIRIDDVYLYSLSKRKKKPEYENFKTIVGRLIFILIIREAVSIQCKIHPTRNNKELYVYMKV